MLQSVKSIALQEKRLNEKIKKVGELAKRLWRIALMPAAHSGRFGRNIRNIILPLPVSGSYLLSGERCI